jgi:magnesium-transporting ATPase (P-type)
MHQIIVNIHVWANVIFTIVAIILCFYTIRGLFFNYPYTKKNLYLEYGYIGILYFGLLLGIILYFFFHNTEDVKNLNIQDLQKNQNSQFWAIEHFSVMVFALLIAQIGKIFTSRSITDKDKYKYTLFYYGIATLIIFTSMAIYLYYKFK